MPTKSPTGWTKGTLRLIALARVALAWEMLWPRLFGLALLGGAFLVLALFGAFSFLPWPLHALALALFVTAGGVLLLRGLEGFVPPRAADAARRLERDSNLPHRPLSEAGDRIAAGAHDDMSQALWRAHESRRATPASLRLSRPRVTVRHLDPKGARFALLALIVAGLLHAGWDAPLRILDALLEPGAQPTLEAWIDPPAYTGLPPRYLSAADASARVPAGSTLQIRLHGASRRPGVMLNSTAGSVTGSGGEYSLTRTLSHDTDVRVRALGRPVASYDLALVADAPPAIALDAPPQKSERDAVRFAFHVRDDYGVTTVNAIIRPKRGGAALVVPLPLAGASARDAHAVSYQDLTYHPYAGLAVSIVLEARDALGQAARTQPVDFTLPQRVFTDPLARALIEQRQHIATGDANARGNAALALNALTIAPELFFDDRLQAYLAVRAAFYGLRAARFKSDLDHVQDLLWQTAVALENGGLDDAAAELRRIQQLLSEALARGAPPEVMAALMERYRAAMQRYMQALARNQQQNPQGPNDPNARSITQKDIDDLMKAIEALAQSGARAEAQAALARLQQLIENMRVARSGGGQGNGQNPSPADKALGDAVQGLSDLMGKQRGLLDKTFRQSQGAGDPKDGGAPGLGRQQQQLRQQMDALEKQLGPSGRRAPKALNDAKRAMDDAARALSGNDLPNAGVAQKEALANLRAAAENLSKLLAQSQGRQDGEQGRDPLGRAQGNGANGDGTRLPGAAALARAREILLELRRRASERGRPQEELDYIDRLLRQF